MSAIDTKTKAAPLFLQGNYLTRFADRQGDLLVSSGVSLRHRLYDMDPSGQWQGETDDDAVDEAIEFGLWLPGMQSAQDVDFIAFLNHNLGSFDLDLSDDNGASYPGGNRQSVAGETDTDTIVSLANAVEADRLRATLHTTQTADDFKRVGAIVVASLLLQPSIGMSQFRAHPRRTKSREAEMADGSRVRAPVYRSDARRYFSDFFVRIDGLDSDEADTLEGILLGSDDFIFVPEPGQRPGRVLLGRATENTVVRDYVSLSRSGGEFVQFDFEEAGGA